MNRVKLGLRSGFRVVGVDFRHLEKGHHLRDGEESVREKSDDEGKRNSEEVVQTTDVSEHHEDVVDHTTLDHHLVR